MHGWLTRSAHATCAQGKSGSSHESFEGDTILMGNDDACKTIGKSSICMKMFDKQVQTLKDVRHIPDLRKNLPSLGVFVAQRHKFSIRMEF